MDRLKNIKVIISGPSSLTSQITNIQMAPPDPILGTKIAFQNDKDSSKMNLGIGAYRDDDGKPYVFKVVQKIEASLHNKVLNHVFIWWHRNIWKSMEALSSWEEPEIWSLELTIKQSKLKELQALKQFQEPELSVLEWSLSLNICPDKFIFLSLLGLIIMESLKKLDLLSKNTLIMTLKPKA